MIKVSRFLLTSFKRTRISTPFFPTHSSFSCQTTRNSVPSSPKPTEVTTESTAEENNGNPSIPDSSDPVVNQERNPPDGLQLTEEQLQIVKDQMKESIKQYIDNNMAVRINKPHVDLSKSIGAHDVIHTRGETRHSQLIREHLDAEPTAESFQDACSVYKDRYKSIRQGHVDFIATGLKFMEPYNLHHKPEVYEALMDCFPRDKFVPRNFVGSLIQVHPQMYLALDLLTMMEENGVEPSPRMYQLCQEIFGKGSLTLQKIARIWFWFDELHNQNPYKLPDETYLDRLDVIQAALQRILSINDYTRQSEQKITIKIVEASPPIQTEDMIDYNRFVVSGFTEAHRSYIEDPGCRTMFVEGPLLTWVNHVPEYYFIMKTGQGEVKATVENELSVDEEREGAIVGICFATEPYEETLMAWLFYMQQENSALRNIDIVFDVPDMKGLDIKTISSS